MNNNLILNRIFTKSTFENLIEKHSNKAYSDVISRYLPEENLDYNLDYISKIYDFLRKEYRNEYFYKNTLLNNLLLGRHSINTTTALTEIPINKSKADFILINGNAIVYEIKTELDTFERLESQINDYYKAFKYVYVVTCENSLDKLKKTLKNDCVGICILKKNSSISTIRKAREYSHGLDYETMFKILRKKEFENIILNFWNDLPDTTDFDYYDECFNLIKKIDLNLLHDEMSRQLKSRVNIVVDEYKKYVPYELKFLVYFSKYKYNDYLKLNEFLNSKFKG
ncbi:sce7726 family protein [Paraclostridium bifermentans]|uniref:sce7726 family protein n=1 Tax=Paraclostridium bifermentans TaxID=1490 RepID=UPI001899611F|nr:sce7726 family protein [Paraclostridium bifermentans]